MWSSWRSSSPASSDPSRWPLPQRAPHAHMKTSTPSSSTRRQFSSSTRSSSRASRLAWTHGLPWCQVLLQVGLRFNWFLKVQESLDSLLWFKYRQKTRKYRVSIKNMTFVFTIATNGRCFEQKIEAGRSHFGVF